MNGAPMSGPVRRASSSAGASSTRSSISTSRVLIEMVGDLIREIEADAARAWRASQDFACAADALRGIPSLLREVGCEEDAGG